MRLLFFKDVLGFFLRKRFKLNVFFRGIIESFKRYKEQGANNVISLTNNNKFAKEGGTSLGGGGNKHPLVDVIADTANINLWNC